MRRKFLEYFSDPINSKGFSLKIIEESGGHIVSGILFNDENWYPIIKGIPRILIKELKTNLLQVHYDFYKRFEKELPGNIKNDWEKEIKKIDNLDDFLKHQKKTGESFAYEWKNIYRENNYEKNNFLHFLSPYLKEEDFKNKTVLDIGCGSGRFTKWGALCEARIAFGIDLGESVEVAYTLTKNMDNVCVIQADIYNMPFENQFDVAYSIGVLHHLPEPQKGFSRLPKVLRSGGKILIWVYNRRNNKRAIYFYEPLRAILKKMPKSFLYKSCYLPGGIVHLINYSTRFLNSFGAKKLAKKIPFSYYANFPFNMKLNDAFDVLATPKSNYYYREEIEKWFSEINLKEIKAFEHPEAGITCVGKK